MAKEKNSDIKLLKLVNRVTPNKSITMGYVLYQSEIIRTSTEVTFNINFMPIVKNELEQQTDDKPEQTAEKAEDAAQPVVESMVHTGPESEFKKDNRLSATADLITKTIKFPHMNKFKLEQTYRGYGLGTFAMNELVNNLKTMFPDFAVEPVYFFFDHKRDDEDRDAFFGFMEKFGFWFKFDDENNNKGLLNIEKAEMLKSALKKDTCVELELAPFIRGIFKERDDVRKELGRIKAEYKKNNTYMNRFEKDQAIRFLTNVIIGMALIILMLMFF